MRPEKILLVAENPDESTLAVWLLKAELPAAEVLEIRDPDALEETVSSGSYDLVLTGNQFSWGNGMMVLSIIRRHLPGCPVVMLTASGNEEIASQALRSGFADYLPASARGHLMLGKRVRKILASEGRTAVSGLIAQYQRLFELVDESVFLATRDGVLLQVNSAFSSFVHCADPETVRGRHLTDFLQARPLLDFLGQLSPADGPKTAEVPLKDVTGKDVTRTVHLTVCLVSQGDRLPVVMVGTIQASRSAPSPLKTIQEGYRSDPAETDEADRDEADLEKVLDHPETDATSSGNVDLEQVLDRVLGDLQPLLDQVRAKIVRGKLPSIEGTYLEMVRLFRNLLSSVIRRRTPKRLEINITAHRMPAEWLFIVKGSGRQIPESDMEPLSAELPDDEYAQPGKGLTLCQRIVERHGGRLWIASESGAGSSIYFTLASEDRALEQGHVDGSKAAN